MYCPKCGKENIDEAKFCQECGFKIDNIIIERKIPHKVLIKDSIFNKVILHICKSKNIIIKYVKFSFIIISLIIFIFLIKYINYKKNHNILCIKYLTFSEEVLRRKWNRFDDAKYNMFTTSIKNNSEDITVKSITFRIDVFDSLGTNLIDGREVKYYGFLSYDIPPNSARIIDCDIDKGLNPPNGFKWRYEVIDARGDRQ